MSGFWKRKTTNKAGHSATNITERCIQPCSAVGAQLNSLFNLVRLYPAIQLYCTSLHLLGFIKNLGMKLPLLGQSRMLLTLFLSLVENVTDILNHILYMNTQKTLPKGQMRLVFCPFRLYLMYFHMKMFKTVLQFIELYLQMEKKSMLTFNMVVLSFSLSSTVC